MSEGDGDMRRVPKTFEPACCREHELDQRRLATDVEHAGRPGVA